MTTSELRFSYSDSFLELLQKARISLLVSTYQANRLITLHASSDRVVARVARFERPTGIAVTAERIALGTRSEVMLGHNLPALIPRLEAPAGVDRCYVLRTRFACGDLDIHEMAWAGDQVWFVNTRFSCLCTWDFEHSFVPRWRPDFISDYAPEDRCHLNGLALRDGKPRYVTALGQADTAEGWRAGRGRAGVLIDTESNELLSGNLNMPHSPRWAHGALWILQSGSGTLCRINPDNGAVETVAALPGFARGLCFWRHYAFIGLSKARDESVFAATRDDAAAVCGVWVIDVNSGAVVAALRFDDFVQELFAVEVLEACSHPELISPESHPELIASTYVLPASPLP